MACLTNKDLSALYVALRGLKGVDPDTAWKMSENILELSKPVAQYEAARDMLGDKHGIIPGAPVTLEAAPKLALWTRAVKELKEKRVNVKLNTVPRAVFQKLPNLTAAEIADLAPVVEETSARFK